jgi:hypothetical protein
MREDSYFRDVKWSCNLGIQVIETKKEPDTPGVMGDTEGIPHLFAERA